uniref:Putative tick transposon n=1 Tax=Ixodes ricinus TaxID=34613 RepID=A0A6B0VBG9_IXORI
MTKPHLFIQVLLLSAIVPSKLAVDCPTVTRGSTDDAHHLFKEDDTVQMPHTPTLLSSASFTNFGWQRGATTAEPGEGLLKPLQRSGQLGLDIATDAMTKPHLFIQVSYLRNAKCFRSNDLCLFLVSSPYDNVCTSWKYLCYCCFHYSYISLVSRLLLALSGDVESNPGPLTVSEQLESILATVQRIEASQSEIFAKVASLDSGLKATDATVQQLSTRLSAVETSLVATSATPGISPVLNMSVELTNIQKQCDDNENRLRRSNLLFFGCPDDQAETWSQSERKIIDFCANNLGVQLDPSNLERSHRLGKFQPNKHRPIIVKFSRFKDKESILAAGFKLKDTHFAVREDFSEAVRFARSKLYEYGKSLNVPFKVRFN